MADSQTVHRYIVVKESLESVGIRMAVELRSIETIGDQKDDLAATGSAIMEQLSGGMDGVVERFGWAGRKVSWRRRGWFSHSEWMARWRGNEWDGASCRRTAVGLGILQVCPQLVEIAGESFRSIESQVETADEGLVARTNSSGDGAQSGSHLCGIHRFQIVVDEDDQRERKSFGSENVNGLFNVVVVDAELFPMKIRNEIAVTIFGSHREDDEIGIDTDLGSGFALLGGGLR